VDLRRFVRTRHLQRRGRRQWSHINVYGRKYAWVGQTGMRDRQASGRVCDWNVTSTSATFISLDHGINVTDNLYA